MVRGFLPSRPVRLGLVCAQRLLWLLLLLLGTPGQAAPAYETVKLGGVRYVAMTDFAARFGLDFKQVDANGAKFQLASKWTKVEFTVGSRECAVNGLRVFMGEGVRGYKGRPYLSAIDVETLLAPMLRPGLDQPVVPRLKTIVIDPGHGGRDSGKTNPGLKLQEKRLTLDTARRLKKILTSRGYKVVLTRDSDRYLELTDRAAVAVQANADLFISVHFNSVASRADQVTGIEVYTLTPQYQYSTGDEGRVARDTQTANPGNVNDHWNSVLGYSLHRTLQDKLKVEDRGLKRARFAVLHRAHCPAVLVEGGFVSNSVEARKLAQPAYREQLAQAMAEGVRSYDLALAGARK
ncbi:MAG: N-acetylmuramoyl-L-alanine amidase [Opitutaceae bacterium]|nr:N-acetylmuramoyl-L-alanine amidase [Opitutaceae bacterium]